MLTIVFPGRILIFAASELHKLAFCYSFFDSVIDLTVGFWKPCVTDGFEVWTVVPERKTDTFSPCLRFNYWNMKKYRIGDRLLLIHQLVVHYIILRKWCGRNVKSYEDESLEANCGCVIRWQLRVSNWHERIWSCFDIVQATLKLHKQKQNKCNTFLNKQVVLWAVMSSRIYPCFKKRQRMWCNLIFVYTVSEEVIYFTCMEQLLRTNYL